jgi:hypothetical protein
VLFALRASVVSASGGNSENLPEMQVGIVANQKEKNEVNEPNEPNESFELTAPKTPAELLQMKKDVERHTAQAIMDLKAKRQAIVDGAKAAVAQAKTDVKKVDEDLRYLGAKREFKARGPRKPKAEAPAAPAAPKKKGK